MGRLRRIGEFESVEDLGPLDDYLLFWYRWPSTQPGSYHELFRNLAGAIRNGEELKVKWKEAITVLEIIEAVNLSSKEGRTVYLV